MNFQRGTNRALVICRTRKRKVEGDLKRIVFILLFILPLLCYSQEWDHVVHCKQYNTRSLHTVVAINDSIATTYINDYGYMLWKVREQFIVTDKSGVITQGRILVNNQHGHGIILINNSHIFHYAFFSVRGNERTYHITYKRK